jgi:uncharacterized protein (TIGR03067 family)
MKNTMKLLSVGCVALLLAVCGCSNSAKKEAAAVQGNWQGEEPGGKQTPTLEFRGSDPQEWYKGTYTLHPETTPKKMIVTITECAFPQYVGKTANAIYKIENGMLTIASFEPGAGSFPASFDAKGVRQISFKK